MAQRERYRIRPVGSSTWVDIPQPDAGIGYNFESVHSEDSGRSYTGKMHDDVLFTYEAVPYKRSALSPADVSKILHVVVGHHFEMQYFSFYTGTWRVDEFYVSKGNLSVGYLNDTTGLVNDFSFNAIAVNPLPI